MTKIFTSKFFLPILQTIIGTSLIAMATGIFYYGGVIANQPAINKEIKSQIETNATLCSQKNEAVNSRVDIIQDRQAKVDSMFIATMIKMNEMQKQIEFIYVNNKELSKYMNVLNLTENDRHAK